MGQVTHADAASVTVDRFYAAIAALDPDALLATLAEDFVGHVTKGIPHIGGVYHGGPAMLAGAWIPARQHFDAMPTAEEILVVGPGRVVGIGSYAGHPSGGKRFSAPFVHVFGLRAGEIVELRQFTDGATWAAALPPGDTDRGAIRRVDPTSVTNPDGPPAN